jgi:hypothetical protein
MSFDSRIVAFAERFLSDRTFELVVAPALADLEFESDAGPRRRAENQRAVLRAVAGGLRDDLARAAGGFVSLMLLPAAYYIFLMVILFDFFSIEIAGAFFVVAALILGLSVAPVAVCFWPERPAVRPID